MKTTAMVPATLALILCLCPLLLSAAEFRKVYPSDFYSEGYGIIQTSDHGYVIVGKVHTGPNGFGSLLVIRTDQRGDLLWENSYSPSASTGAEGRSLIETPSGNLLVAGSAYMSGRTGPSVYLVSLDPQGTLMWDKIIERSGADSAVEIVKLEDGGSAVAANTRAEKGNRTNVWIIRLDKDGRQAWEKAYDFGEDEAAVSLASTGAGALLVAGQSVRGATLFQVTSSQAQAGDIVWKRVFAYPYRYEVRSIVPADSGSFLAVGAIVPACSSIVQTQNTSQPAGSVLVLKFTAEGDIVWEQAFGSSGDSTGVAAVSTADGGYAVISRTSPRSANVGMLIEGSILRIDRDGKKVWWKSVPGYLPEGAARVAAVDSDGNFAVAGASSTIGASGNEQSRAWLLLTEDRDSTADSTIYGEMTSVAVCNVCPAGTFVSSSGSGSMTPKCQGCSSFCYECEDARLCQSCMSGYQIRQGECVPERPFWESAWFIIMCLGMAGLGGFAMYKEEQRKKSTGEKEQTDVQLREMILSESATGASEQEIVAPARMVTSAGASTHTPTYYI